MDPITDQLKKDRTPVVMRAFAAILVGWPIITFLFYWSDLGLGSKEALGWALFIGFVTGTGFFIVLLASASIIAGIILFVMSAAQSNPSPEKI